MRIKVVKGNDAGGLCNYLLDPRKQIEAKENPVLYSNMSGSNAEELAEEFRFSGELNRRVKVTMCHYSVSMPVGEKIEIEKIAGISKQLLKEMGHERCQYFVVQHHDREHENDVQHWHVATSAIALNGKWVDDSFNRQRLRLVEQNLEREFGLRQTVMRAARERHNLTTGEYRLKARSGTVLPKEKLWQKIQKAAEDKPNMTSFVERLQRDGVTVRLNGLDEDKKVQGISYGIDGSAFPGGKLGVAYSLQGTQKHLGVNYDAKRDDEALAKLLKTEGERLGVAVKTEAVAVQEIGSGLSEIRANIRRMRENLSNIQDKTPIVEPVPETKTKPAPEVVPEPVQQTKHKPKPEIDLEL